MKKKIFISAMIISILLVLVIVISSIYIINGYYQNRCLFEAIESNDILAATKAVDNGAFLNTRKHILASVFPLLGNIVYTNPTPLILACESGNKDVIDLLLNEGAKINKSDNVRTVEYTPVYAVLNSKNENRYNLACYLIERGASIDNKETAELVMGKTLFIDLDATQNEISDAYELFQLAARSLIKNGDFDWWVKVNGYEKNILVYCAQYRNERVVEYLIAYDKANAIMQVDTDGTTALIAATKAYNMEIARLLVDAGAILTAKDDEGKTAYDYAKEKRYDDIANLVKP